MPIPVKTVAERARLFGPQVTKTAAASLARPSTGRPFGMPKNAGYPYLNKPINQQGKERIPPLDSVHIIKTVDRTHSLLS
jgi:hypothetical protein